jgi:anti-sigma-K factor RskA
MADDPMIGVDDRELDDAALEALAEAYAAPPPPLLRERLLGEARRDLDVARVGRVMHRWRIVGAVAAGAALALGVVLSREARVARVRTAEVTALASANSELTRRVEEQAQSVASLREALAAQAQVLRVVGAPRTLSASLEPSQGARGTGRILVDAKSGEAAVVLAGLPPAGADKVYELWAIRGSNPPEPAGLLAVPSEQAVATRVATVERPGEVTAFAVSIEPSGGSTSPTGPIVLVGAVAG